MPRSAEAPNPRKGEGHGNRNAGCRAVTARVATQRFRPPTRRPGCFRDRWDTLVLGLVGGAPRLLRERASPLISSACDGALNIRCRLVLQEYLLVFASSNACRKT